MSTPEPTSAESELIDEFAADMAALVRAVPQDRREGVKKALGGIYGMLLALRRQVRELEARPAVKYLGTWQDGETYPAGSLCTHGGSMWHAERKTSSKPGTDASWRLAVKNGAMK